MEIRVLDPAVPGDIKTEGTPEGNKSEITDLNPKGIITGEILLNEATAQTQAIEEEAETEQSEKPEKPKQSGPERDTASVRESSDLWDEEEWKEAFQQLTDWCPSETIPVSEELNRLAKIYQELFLAVLIHGTKEGEEADRLNQELSLLLQKLLVSRLGDLELLFNNYGSAVSITALRAAVCRSVMGKNLTDAELNQMFGSITPVRDNQNEASTGIIYQPAGAGTIKNNPGYTKNLMKETSLMIMERGVSLKGKEEKNHGASLTISPLKTGRVYEIKDLETAQRFASYLTGEGNLFKLAGLTGKSEELWGLLAALMSIKTQIFASSLGLEKGLAMDLREAGDRLTDEWIQEMAARSSQNDSGTSGRKPVFETKAVYKIFYYIMNLYQTKADVNQAANKGLRYAYQQFLKKKEITENAREPEPFFTKEKRNPAEDFKEGRRLIERDWNDFSAFLNSGNFKEVPQGVLILSPWGMLAEPETDTARSEGAFSPVFLAGGAAALIVLILIFVFLRF